jgi:pimeloyl-ACP methyl ester carboxylesterase
MIPPFTPASLESIRHVDAVEGFWVPVRVSGPDNGRVVVMFDETPPETAVFDAVRRRLHVAMLRTVVIPTDRRLTAKSVVGVLDRLGVPAGLLVGDRAGGELAWNVATTQRERFTGLVVIDSGHPRVPDTSGVIRDQHCPPVHADTTALVSSPAAHAVGRASRRYVHGEFRLVELAGRRKSRHFTAQLTAEIVLRSHSW